MSGRIPLWLDLRAVPVHKRLGLLRAATDAGCEALLLDKGDPHLERPGLRAVAVHARGRLREGAATVGRLVQVKGPKDQKRAADAEGIVVVEADDWKVIPLENLVAARAGRPGTLFARAANADEARLFAQVLEAGVHGVVLAPSSAADIAAADLALRGVRAEAPVPSEPAAPPAPPAPAEGRLALVPATVTSLSDAGMGDRVCVDCTSVFNDGEGLLVGSAARSLLLVHAETPASGFVAPRPFRVNAGAVHSYVLVDSRAPAGKTRYLSELRAGDEALAVGRDGATRTVAVGRCKVERRPHTMVKWTTAAGEASAVLQTAETIRLVRPDGALVAVTELKPGQQVLVHEPGAAARHTGVAVAERVEER